MAKQKSTEHLKKESKELEGIADLGRINPAIDSTYFPNTQSTLYWTATPRNYGALIYAWYVSFDYGGASHSDRITKNFVRLVR